MKKLFFTSLIICVISFMCAGISRILLGEKDGYRTSETVDEAYYDENYLSGDIYETGYYELPLCPYISLNTSGADVKVVPGGDGGMIGLKLTIPEGEHIYVDATKTDNETLTIEIRPDTVTFFGDADEFGTVDWLEDIFHGSSNIKAEITMPQTIYESLNCKLGSGKLTVSEIAAWHNDISVGSGNFQIIGKSDFAADNFVVKLNSGNFEAGHIASGDYNINVNSGSLQMNCVNTDVADNFKVDLSSGKAVITGMYTDSYDFNIGSGSFDFSGLTGSGQIDMGSGKGVIAYAESDEPVDLEMGSGLLDIYLPENGTTVSADFGSGSIAVNGFGMNQKFTDDFDINLGNALNAMNIDMGSGIIKIGELSSYTPPAEVEISEVTVTDTSTVEAESMEGAVITVEQVPNEAPEAPSAPEAPDAPAAPEAPEAPAVPEATAATEAPMAFEAAAYRTDGTTTVIPGGAELT